MSTFESVVKAIATQLELDPSAITLESRLTEDLKTDSVDVIEIVMNLENEHGIEFEFDELGKLVTVGDVVSYLDSVKK